MTREKALQRLETENTTPVELVESVLAIMGLKLSDLRWPQDWFSKEHDPVATGWHG